MVGILGIIANFLIGWVLFVSEPNSLPTWLVIALGTMIVLASSVNILAFGLYSLGWRNMLSNISEDDALVYFRPGTDDAKDFYKKTLEMIGDTRWWRIYLSFAASIMLMIGILTQGWMLVLVFEVLGSAIGYGFIRWAIPNLPEMKKVAYGEKK